ncbi:MAG: hypothetical protein FWD23_06950 [Oscillospiraceae bacterium]|nr:hypothetical protein [Oscillospiraceae bacterium]
MKFKTAFVLTALMLAQLLFWSCGEQIKTEPPENTHSSGDAGEVQETADYLPPLDFKGAEFNVLTRTLKKYDVSVDEQNGEVVNDAIFFRNVAVEERLNIKINTHDMPGEWDDWNRYLAAITKSVMSGLGAYDLITGFQVCMVSTVGDALYKDLSEIGYLDLDKPWWTKKINDEMTVNNKIYLATGDVSVILWESIYALMFNKNMLRDYNVPNLYQSVKSGRWTLEELIKVTKDITQDIDGNGKYDKNDLYGFGTMIGNFTDNYYVAFDIPVTKWDENGYPYLTENCDKMYQLNDIVYDFLNNNVSVFSPEEANASLVNVLEPMFFSDRLMIMPTFLGDIKNMREMDTDFGIIPYPKWDENQKEYLTTSHGGFNVFGIPEDARDTDMSGAALEALCAESSKTVVPAFYETVLKSKFARDEESAEMLDIIRNGLSATFGYLYMVPIGQGSKNGWGPGLILRETLRPGGSDYAAYYEKYEGVFDANLEKIIEAYKNLE